MVILLLKILKTRNFKVFDALFVNILKMVQLFNYSMVQLFNDTMVQLFNGTIIQCFD